MALIEAFFCQEATIRPYLREGSGEPIYGETETRPCRMERGRKIKTTYKNPDGQIDQVVAEAKMFCVGSPIPEKSLVTCDGQEFVVIQCKVLNGFYDHHLEVYLM